ncbi:alkaline phosphatase D family protein [Myxococcaceae bacterium GXIMD 01537]
MQQKLHRRTLLQCIAAVAASTAFGCSDEETSRLEGRDFFPQSLASGDPRPTSVVLWTRAVDADAADKDTPVKLEVSTQENFSSLVLELKDLKALAAHDHALKVKVTNLSPRTTYYYRFSYEKDGQTYSTVTGRTRTAPAATDDAKVKFAFASCQDYVGRYYNSWARLLQLDEDLDFVVFLGDYIYETTGDANFQSSTGGGRTVNFSDNSGALVQKQGFLEYYAAASVSNYRDVYKTVRGDTVLQKVHERYPFIVVWDDHEFSDDCWGANATYLDGRASELQQDRRRNAEQAFFEYIPLDHPGMSGEGAVDVASVPRFPASRIYRDFEFGKHLKLAVTDMRTYRPDHLIPEDAYPGTVVVNEATLKAAAGGTLPAPFASDMFSYVDIDAAGMEQVKGTLRAVYQQQARAAGVSDADIAAKAEKYIKGNQALAYVNQVLAAAKAPAIDPAGKPKGLAFVHMGKVGLFDLRGSRYVVVKDTFDVYAGLMFANPQTKAVQDALGADQEAWLKQAVGSANTWNVVVSSVSLTSMVWDLRDKSDIPDPTLRQRFYFNVDQWDGFPHKKAELLGFMKAAQVSNPLFISGDIHASFASVEGGIPTLTAPAITSGSIQELAATAVRGAGYTTQSAVYKHAVANMDATLTAANPGMVYSNSDHHGFVVVELSAAEALASYHLIPSTEVGIDYSLRPAEALTAKFKRKDFRVKAGAITPV